MTATTSTLEDHEFPPLGSISTNKRTNDNCSTANLTRTPIDKINLNGKTVSPDQSNPDKKSENGSISACEDKNPTDTIKSKVGVMLTTFEENVEPVLEEFNQRQQADYIILQLEPPRSYETQQEFRAISDQVVSGHSWRTKVNLNLGYANLDTYNGDQARHFSSLFGHALYLPTKVLVLDCPTTRLGCASVASIVNDHLVVLPGIRPLVLFKVPIVRRQTSHDDVADICNKSQSNSKHSTEEPIGSRDGWSLWNYLRGHLNPDARIGICLHIDDDLPDNREELNRWTGEPVRMILIDTDQFTKSIQGTLTLSSRCAAFMEKLTVANSLRTSFVIESSRTMNVGFEVEVLRETISLIEKRAKNQHKLLSWHNTLHNPCLPVSSDLPAEMYESFEQDDLKYSSYRTAMADAIKTLTSRLSDNPRVRVLMVLGAGRGPLVDQYIKAIGDTTGTKYRYKIYALDKNKSAVRALIYKQETKWKNATSVIEVEVIEADMRSWAPGIKADIIASEMLGPFSDNELSPECIDGAWRLATPETICIPRRYSSFIGPVSSYVTQQSLYHSEFKEPYDKIHAVKLQSYYEIDSPKALFEFEHQDISKRPMPYQNERHVSLSFTSKVDTICHGFTGYFECELYGKVKISTNPNSKTPHTEGSFGSFVPLQAPIPMPKGSRLVVHFWRKMSESQVWYQWTITEPNASRIHSPLVLSHTQEGSVMSMLSSQWIV